MVWSTRSRSRLVGSASASRKKGDASQPLEWDGLVDADGPGAFFNWLSMAALTRTVLPKSPPRHKLLLLTKLYLLCLLRHHSK